MIRPSKTAQRTPPRFAAAADEGLAHGGRRLFLQVYPRGAGCLAAVVDGREGARTTSAAAVVLGSFTLSAPDEHVRPLLDLQAGWELMRARQGPAALARFEAALATAPVTGTRRPSSWM